MKLKKRGQSSLEFLYAYGWVIIVVIFTISLLVDIVLPKKFCPPTFSTSDMVISIYDHKIIGSNSEIPEVSNLFYFILQSNFYENIELLEFSIFKGRQLCGNLTFGNEVLLLEKGEKTNILQGSLLDGSCFGEVKGCYKFVTRTKYKGSNQMSEKTSDGALIGKFEDVNERWKLDVWRSTNYSNSIVEDRAGEKLNYCVEEDPPDVSSYTGTFPPGILTWQLPNGCSANLVGQKGFQNICGINVPQLSKGWLHNTLYVDRVFEGHTVYLGGEAVYFDTVENKWKNNGICLNDNLYFYVNGDLKYYGGTTGRMIPPNNQYNIGDEVLRDCGGCEVVDSSRWCIPAFKLTNVNFNFGEINQIDILVEDFCKGNGQTNAGGMSPLIINLI